MKNLKLFYPIPGDKRSFSYLPRDVKLGQTEKKGLLLAGFDENTGTRQLWECIGNNTVVFVGYIVEKL